MTTKLPKLHCDGCRACCLGDTIILMPEKGDRPQKWPGNTELVLQGPNAGKTALKKGSDGNCVFLDEKGCTIHGKAPHMCGYYDCRVHVLNVEAREGQFGVQKRLSDPKMPSFRIGWHKLELIRGKS
jgi:Fe-S-cluster containining protein